MMTALLVIHMMIAAALIGFVLIQKSEGGALGIGGGGGGGFMTGRGQANFLTRTTSILGAMFFLTSILLTLLAQGGGGSGGSLLDRLGNQPGASAPSDTTKPADPAAPGSAPASGGGVLDDLSKGRVAPLDR